MADICFIVSRCNIPEFLGFDKIVFNQMPPFIDFLVVWNLRFSVAFRRNNSAGFAFCQFVTQPVCIESLVTEKGLKLHIFDNALHPKQVMALTGEQRKPDQIPQGIDKSHDFGGQALL